MNTKDGKVIVVASAGGHLTQALCATALLENIILVTTVSLKNARIQKLYKVIDTQFNPFIHFINLLLSLYILIRERPRSVFSTGGPLVLPFALLCRLFSVKYVHLDTLSRVVELSNTVSFLHKHHLYDRLFCQWEGIAEKHGIDYIGKSFDLSGASSQNIAKLPKEKPVNILVTTGTCPYPFSRLAEMLYVHPLYKHPDVHWTIQSRGFKLRELAENCTVLDLVSRQEMDELILNSHYVISHCGIGSINLMLSYAKKAVFVPRVAKHGEFSDDHQLQIANEIKGTRFDVVMPGENLPDVSFDDLLAVERISQPVDVTNYDLAEKMKKILLEKKG